MTLVYIGILNGVNRTVNLTPCPYNSDIGYNVKKYFGEIPNLEHVQVYRYVNGKMELFKHFVKNMESYGCNRYNINI